MMNRLLKLLVVLLLSLGGLPLFWPATAQRAPIDFSRDIQPIFQTHCAGCHGAQKALSQLRLDNKHENGKLAG